MRAHPKSDAERCRDALLALWLLLMAVGVGVAACDAMERAEAAEVRP